jgi:hypothetical protein
VEPDFCNKLMTYFNDRAWINCRMLDDAIMRAFESWAANHQMISFINVSAHCATDAAVVACSEGYRTRCSGLEGDESFECLAERGAERTLSSCPDTLHFGVRVPFLPLSSRPLAAVQVSGS